MLYGALYPTRLHRVNMKNIFKCEYLKVKWNINKGKLNLIVNFDTYNQGILQLI